MVQAIFTHILQARVVTHVLAHVVTHVLARVIMHVHDYYLKTCNLARPVQQNATYVGPYVQKRDRRGPQTT